MLAELNCQQWWLNPEKNDEPLKKAAKPLTIRYGRMSRTFIIAEAGVNHNAHMDLALQLVNQAVLAGADATQVPNCDPGDGCNE